MKQKKISLFIFIDAFGWEILQNHPHFLEGMTKGCKKLDTILGYSSACDPSIISGLHPSEHMQWSSFYYSPQTCPYAWVKWLQLIPSFLTNNHRIRHKISQWIAKVQGFTGYFQIYNVPFKFLPFFDYAEKKWMWGTQNGLIKGFSIFDHLLFHHVPFYVKESFHVSDEEQWQKVNDLISEQKIDFSYLLLGKLDAVMHAHGTKHANVDKVIQDYDLQIRALIKKAESQYQEVSWYVFSDHGMHDVKESYDLQSSIDLLCLRYGVDYVAMYDSTMGRFWYFNEHARKTITGCLERISQGKILSDAELKKLGVFFPDKRYGETIFLMNTGILIVPSFMGKKSIPGMHGYHPNDLESSAMICSNRVLPEDLKSIEQIFWLMIQELQLPLLKPNQPL